MNETKAQWSTQNIFATTLFNWKYQFYSACLNIQLSTYSKPQVFKQKAVTSHPTNATSTRRPKEFADLVFQRITNSLLSYFLEAVNKLRLWAVGTVLSPESTVCPVCFLLRPICNSAAKNSWFTKTTLQTKLMYLCINDLALARCPVCWISRFYTSENLCLWCTVTSSAHQKPEK